MKLTLQQAADALGKSRRQVRYLIEHGELRATKVGRQWRIDSDDLPRTPGQEQARERKQEKLRDAVEEALELPRERRRRYSVKDLRAFQIAAAAHQGAAERFGPDHATSVALHETLELLARGCHRFRHADKAAAYAQARDAASRAACELALLSDPQASTLLEQVEQQLMAALAGLLRRMERKLQALAA